MKINYLILLGNLFLLAACVSPQITTPKDWQAQRDWKIFDASGRLGVKINDKGSYANFNWTRVNGVETIDINTPLGNTVGQLCRDAEGVLALNSHGKLFTANTPSELSEQLLGYDLPIENLSVWANGEWVKDIAHGFTSDGKLKQLGWIISRELNEDGTPHILLLESDKLTLRLVFTEISRTQGQPEKTELCEARVIH